jgi:murein DD-endopeptidase MepM/ murein hydrolase activator NlpD
VLLGAVLLLAGVLVLFPTPAPGGESGLSTASAASLSDQLEDSRARLQKVRDSLAKAQAARKAALGDIAAIDQNIDGAEKELRIATATYDEAAGVLAQLRAELDVLTVELTQKRKELKRTERDLSIQQEVFNERLTNVYKSGGRLMYLAALFQPAAEPTSISELMGRFDLLSSIAEQDYDILTQIDTLKAKIEEQKAALETERVHVSALEQKQRATTKTLAAQAEKKQAAVDELENALAAKNKVLAAAEKDVAAWSRQEDELSAESGRIADQIKAAQAAANSSRSSASSGGDGGGGGGGSLYRPVPGAITSAFGYRMHPIFHVRKMHTGVDMHAGMGTPIRAAESGTVISAGWRGGYGKCVVIAHGGNLATLYGHQSTILVSAGETVERGEVIGKVGSTGYSTGPHLHFEVRVGGSPVNPANYL